MAVNSFQDWFPLAELLRPQGRRGELLADPLTDLAGAFSAGADVFLARSGQEPAADSPPIKLEQHWQPTGRNAARIVLKLSAANTISEAEALEGQTVYLRGSDAPQPAAGEWFVRDLIGCTLLDGATPVGEVTGVEFPVASDGRRLEDAATLLVVTQPNGEEAMVPMILAWIRDVDPASRRILMDLPAGLLTEAPE